MPEQSYCGLVGLLVCPQAFRKKAFVATLAVIVVVVPTIFPWFRYLFWLFEGDYYRTYSLFCVLILTTFSMIGFSDYVSGSKLNLLLLAVTTAALLVLLFVPIANSRALLEPHLGVISAIFLLGYVTLLVGGQLLRRQRLAGYLILIIAAVELSYFSRVTVSHRDFVTKSEMESRTGYNDATVDAVRDLRAKDESLFFRLTKPRPAILTQSIGLNDALVYGYYGTSSYSSFNNANYTDFLTVFGEVPPNSELHTRWAVGTLNNPLLSTFVGEKYALVDDPGFLRNTLNYHFVKQYGPNYLFRNEYFLPIGLSFTRGLSEEQFLTLPVAARAEMLFRVAILSQPDARELPPLTQHADASIAPLIEERRRHALRLTSFQQSKIEGTIQLDEPSVVVLQTSFARGWHAYANGEEKLVRKVDFGLLGVVLPSGEHKLRFQFRNEWLLPGAVLSLLSLLLATLGCWRWPRLRT